MSLSKVGLIIWRCVNNGCRYLRGGGVGAVVSRAARGIETVGRGVVVGQSTVSSNSVSRLPSLSIRSGGGNSKILDSEDSPNVEIVRVMRLLL